MYNSRLNILMMPNPLNILLIGGGRWAQVYIRELIAMPLDVEINLYVLSRTNADFIKLNYPNIITINEADILVNHKITFDLAIVSTVLKRHLSDTMLALTIASRVIIEKPCFDDPKQFTEILSFSNQQNINNNLIYTSCPFLFANSIYEQISKHSTAYLNITCEWHEEYPHPSAYRYDDSVGLTAISHFLPVILAVLNSNYQDLSQFEVSGKQCSFAMKSGYNDLAYAVIQFSRTALKSRKTITFHCVEDTINILDLMDSKLKSCGARFDLTLPCNFLLSPLQSMILSILSDNNSLNQYIRLTSLLHVSYLFDSSIFK